MKTYNPMTMTAGLLLLLCTTFGFTKSEHFITDAAYRTRVENDFKKKQTAFADSSLFAIFRTEMIQPEREAMEFLYAYMPIGDVADYDGSFYLRNVRAAFKARREMPWGQQIPEDIFRHFVLPIRVNNENLDESRTVFFDELKDRVRGLSLREAVLEVNHWCHEKVIYTPSDARTSSPLASVCTAYGRCGEESTFTVAALRAVGIPARQVYTPRWAHTDDNHAWVEAWVDGRWYFFGACEPEPALNLAWFNAPAYRGMLMHTKVFGYYDGPEDVMERTACYTEINVIDNYAPTGHTTVTVTSADGKPVEDARVEFKLYNYAEFYTVARKHTDAEGHAVLTAGKGDMLVWVTKDGRYGFRKVTFGKDNAVTIALDHAPGDTASVEMDIVPPVEGAIPSEREVTDAEKAENAKRMAEEDSIRNAYVATFYTDTMGVILGRVLGLPELNELRELMPKTRGNHEEIAHFLREAKHAGKLEGALSLLYAISEKDLRDTPADVLLDHLNHTPQIPENLYEKETVPTKAPPIHFSLMRNYVMNPRIWNEYLTPYKRFFAEHIDKALATAARRDPQALVDWVKANITLRNDLNPQYVLIMPTGVWRARIADTYSRNIFFVAVARSLGIPARIELMTGKVQYYNHGWRDVNFDADRQKNAPQGKLTASYTPTPTLDNPKYYSHFTIARLRDDGQTRTLDFEAQEGKGDTWYHLLQPPASLSLDCGHYMLVTGTRMASGKVLARLVFFSICKGETTNVNLVMRADTTDISVIGSIDAEAKFTDEKGASVSILSTTGRGYFIIGLLGARQEPTNHALRDIARLKADFDGWGRGMVLLFKDKASLDGFDRNEFGALPSTITWGADTDGSITRMIAEAMKLRNTNDLPIFIIADTFGRVVFVSQGYTIGLGEQMMQVVRKL